MTHYPRRQGGSNRQQILATFAVCLFFVAVLTFLSFATSMTGIAMEPTPMPAPGFP